MVRPREFDTDIVTDRALDLFWRQGYECASLADLERETGVGRKGLYNTFGSKQGLFLEVLRRYEERAVELVLAPLESEGAGRAEIAHVVNALTSQVGTAHGNRGCLICLTAESEVTGSKEVAQRVHGYLQRLRNGFAGALRGARTAGDLTADKDPEVLADFLVGTMMGLSAMARAGRPRAQIMNYADTALATLD
jgi:TetR/AcrR family transcriptional regulator, transcriptional repressor for nem operon